MRTVPARLTGILLAGAALAGSRIAPAHPVTVDGSAAEWFTRLPNTYNLGLIARNAAGEGEYIWRDVAADTRTDLTTPEVVADIFAFNLTGDKNGVGFLVRRSVSVSLADSPIQMQIAIDMDRVDGSGQEYFAEFADTKVAAGARWERLVETLFGSGGAAKVIDADFNMVAAAEAQQGANGVVEIFVPWGALGLAGPPETPLRFTVAAFRAKGSDVTIDVGGPTVSNALDTITDHGNPSTSTFPNTFADVQDQVVDYSFDVYFRPDGEVHAPLVVQRFSPNPTFGGPDEWYVVKNVTPAEISLAGFKLGDEETPDGFEGMFAFPDTATLGAGAWFTVARVGSAYQSYFGAPPDAELPPVSLAAVPDMTAFGPWASGGSGSMSLTNTGDEVIVLDRSNTLVDIVVYGTGAYSGIQSFTPAPGLDQVLTRGAASSDTDGCLVDFSNAGGVCTGAAQCAGPCFDCVGGACEPKAQGAGCPDADPCNGDEICDGAGACVTSPDPPCDDMNPCTADTCAPVTGCAHDLVAAGTPCSDGSVCNGDEVCDAAGACLPGAPLDCDDGDPCTIDSCDAVDGCSTAAAPAGTDCSDADVCDGAEACDAAGACLPGAPLDCDDGDPCTVDSCDAAAGCDHVKAADSTACSDGDPCNGDEVCMGGVCTAGAPPDCDDQNECTVDACQVGSGCAHSGASQGSPCDDGDPCTQADACDGDGACVPGEGVCGGAGGGGAGAGGAGGTTTTTTTGSGGDGGAGAQPEEGSCGCRVPGSRAPEGDLAWLATAATAVAFLLRRRRSVT